MGDTQLLLDPFQLFKHIRQRHVVRRADPVLDVPAKHLQRHRTGKSRVQKCRGRFSVRVAGSGEVVSVKPDALQPHWSERIVGKTGTLAGLEKTPEMNGASVEVVSADRERGRVGVRLVGSADVVSVRRACFVAAA